MMKSFLQLAALLGYSLCLHSQTYHQLRESSAKLREKKDYDAAFQILTKGMQKANGHPYHNDLYDAAALGILTGRKDTAFYYLTNLLYEGEYNLVTCTADADEDFKNLKSDSRWRQ